MSQKSPLLNIDNLKVHLPLEEGVLKAVDGLSLTIEHGQTLGLVGESGCGKSMTALSILRIAPRFAQTSGSIVLHPRSGPPLDLVGLDAEGKTIRTIRGGEIAMIFQEPMTSFSPLYTIGNQVIEAIRLHRTPDKQAAREIAVDMLERVRIPGASQTLDKYPQELSGGMRQRAMIAMALSCHPSLLVADEPTTALDVTVQAQVLRLMRDLQAEFGMSILYITHDLGVIARMVSEVAVMYLGRIVEIGSTPAVIANPAHPYTRALLAAVPEADPELTRHKQHIALRSEEIPKLTDIPRGCAFHPRCPYFQPGVCDVDVPELARPDGWTQEVACIPLTRQGALTPYAG